MSAPLLPPQAAVTPLLCPEVPGKPFHLPQRSAPSRQETAPFTSESETCPGSDPAVPPGSLPALTRPLLPSRRCLQRHLLRARLPVAGPGRCEWAPGRGGTPGGAGAGPERGPGADRPRPAVYHVIFIYCAVKGHRGFQFFYLPYFEK